MIEALLWPYLARLAELWPEDAEPRQDPQDPRIPGLIDEAN